MTRGQSYLHRYMASLAYPSLLAAAEQDYETAEEQRRYVDGLVEAERATLKRLEDNFTALQEQRRYFDTTALEGLLQDAEVAQGLRTARAGAAAGRLDPTMVAQLRRAGSSENENLALGRADELLRKSSPLTAAQQETARSLLQNISPETLDRLFADFPPAPAAAPGGVSTAETQAAALLGELAATADTAIVGGAEGEAEVLRL